MESGRAYIITNVISMPLVWALAFFITSSEAVSFFSPTGANAPSSLGILSLVLDIAVYIFIFHNADKIGTLSSQPWLVIASPAFGIVGMLLRITQDANSTILSLAYALTGEFCMAISLTIVFFISLELLACHSLPDVKNALIVCSVINVALTPLAATYPIVTFFVTIALCAPCLWAALKTRKNTAKHSLPPKEDSLKSHRIKFPVRLALGLSVVSLCFGFLQFHLLQTNHLIIAANAAITKLIAIILFALVMHKTVDAGYSTLAKLTSTFSIASFSLVLAFGSQSLGASACMATGYSILEVTLYLIIVDIALFSKTNLLKIASAFYIVDSAAYVIGELLAEGTILEMLEVRILSIILILLLAVTAIWIFQDKAINSFLWVANENPEQQEAKNELGFEKKVGIVARRYHLSPRETEVLKLFATGRSAAFIAELMFVTTNTVRTHVKHIYEKCGIHSRQELITLIEQADEERPV